MDRGEFSSIEVVGMEYVDRTMEDYKSTELDGLFISLVLENDGSKLLEFEPDSVEIIDVNGFSYSPHQRALYTIEDHMPSGWFIDISELKPHRKYRYIIYIKGFHGEVARLSYVPPGYYDNEFEDLEVDLTANPQSDLNDIPILNEAFDEIENEFQ